jgi:hypothetical protein
MAKKNNLRQNEFHNLATFGQFGIRELVTTEESFKEEKFFTVRAQINSTFTAESYGGGDSPLTFTIKADDKIEGPFKNITGVTGHIFCYKSDEFKKPDEL